MDLIINHLDLLIGFVFVHPVSFRLKFTDFPNSELLEEINDNKYVLSPELEDEIQSLDWHIGLKEGLKSIKGESLQNGNSGRNGGGCGDLNLPVSDFNFSIERESGITIGDLTEVIYRLKGSKYDWFCERLSGFKINEEESTEEFLKFSVKFHYCHVPN